MGRVRFQGRQRGDGSSGGWTFQETKTMNVNIAINVNNDFSAYSLGSLLVDWVMFDGSHFPLYSKKGMQTSQFVPETST